MEPSDEELLGLMPQQLRDDLATVSRMAAHGAGPDVTPGLFEASLTAGALQFVRAVLAHRGHQPAPPAEGEVADLIAWLGDEADQYDCIQQAPETARRLRRAADLLQQRHPTPVPVSERLPGPGDCDAEGLCWVWHTTAYTWGLFRLDPTVHSHWLPATALPLPAVEVRA